MLHHDEVASGVDRRAADALDSTPWLRMARAAIAACSPAGKRARLSILIYHRVVREADPLFPDEVDASRFGAQIEWIRTLFNVLPLEDAVARLKAGALPARAACITFDDGYADNAEVALPILRRYGTPATFFVATAFIDGGRMWNDTLIESVRLAQGDDLDLTSLGLSCYPLSTNAARRAAIDALIASTKYLAPVERDERVEAIRSLTTLPKASGLMLRSAQIRELLNAGMSIGAHTHTHPILARLSANDARREIVSGRERLEAVAGTSIALFAYPNGKPGVDYLPEHVDLVKTLAFTAAVTTARGAARHSADPFQLPRFTPWDRTAARFALRMLRNFS